MIQNFLITFPQDYKVSNNGIVSNKVAVIKAIRTLTCMGLAEAKNISEKSGQQNLQINLGAFAGSFPNKVLLIEEQFRVLRQHGCNIGPSVHVILQQLRDLGADALKQGEDELANEILQLVLAEKLRRVNNG